MTNIMEEDIKDFLYIYKPVAFKLKELEASGNIVRERLDRYYSRGIPALRVKDGQKQLKRNEKEYTKITTELTDVKFKLRLLKHRLHKYLCEKYNLVLEMEEVDALLNRW